MLIFKKLSRKPTHFLRYTGLTVDILRDRQICNYALLGYLFDPDPSNLCRNMKELRPLIEAALPNPKRMLAKVVETANRIRLIQRARRNRPLTETQKQLNSLRSSVRIGVEHTLSRVKKYRIAAEVYRGRESA